MQNFSNLNFGFYPTFSNDTQDIKDIKANENVLISSIVSHPLLYSIDKFKSPPQNAIVNCCYLIDDNPSGDFEEMANKVAFYNQNGWRFFELINGITFFVFSVSAFYYYFNGSFNILVPPQQSQSNSASYKVGDYKNSAINYDHDGFLLCDGRLISISTYSQLFSVIGSSFGGGYTTFALPDFRCRVFGGVGQGEGLSNRLLGQKIGSETHTLSIAEMPSHSHVSLAVAGSVPRLDLGKRDYPGGWSTLTERTSMEGGSKPHNNMQPTLFGGGVFIYSGVN